MNKPVMDKALFRLSDNEKADIIFDLLNPDWDKGTVSCFLCEIYDDYALSISPNGYQRTYYTKDGDNITLGETVSVKIVDATETEYAALEAMKSAKGSFEAVASDYTAMTEQIAAFEQEKIELTEKVSIYEQKIAELEQQIETYKSSAENNSGFEEKIKELLDENVKLNSELSDIKNENATLVDFKINVENQAKEEILNKYSEYLTDESITNYKNNIDTYTVENFKKDICTEVLETRGTTLFTENKTNNPMIFKNDASKTSIFGALALLNNRKTGGNK